MKTKLILGVACMLLTSLFSCKKTAGSGGKAGIKGKVWVEDWNTSYTIKNGEYAGVDLDVYIIYGDDVSYGDRTKTSYTGEFEFKYLRKGKYKVYVYSKDNTLQSISGKISIVKDVEITNNKQNVELEQFITYN